VKSVRITGPRQCEVADVTDPRASGDFAVVRILAAPMCTEYKLYRDGKAGDTLGHEAAGEVVEVAQPGRVRVGDRVVVMPQYPCGRCALCLAGDYIHCEHVVDPLAVTGNAAGRATYAELMIKPDWLLLPIPDAVSIDHGAMACCGLGPTFGAMEKLKVTGLDTVLITGLGPVGLGGVINARFRGARVLGVESHPYRARLARELGAEEVLDPGDPAALERIRELTRGVGVDKAIDCSGVPAAQRFAIDAVRRRGEVAFVGEGGELAVRVSNDLIRKGIALRGSWHYPLGDYHGLVKVIEGSAAALDRLITHRFPLSRVRDAWELQLTGDCGKVILQPGARS
jgi:L-iditol 2-dehydrogenase